MEVWTISSQWSWNFNPSRWFLVQCSSFFTRKQDVIDQWLKSNTSPHKPRDSTDCWTWIPTLTSILNMQFKCGNTLLPPWTLFCLIITGHARNIFTIPPNSATRENQIEEVGALPGHLFPGRTTCLGLEAPMKQSEGKQNHVQDRWRQLCMTLEWCSHYDGGSAGTPACVALLPQEDLRQPPTPFCSRNPLP